jgi:hypothetical protein
MSLLRNPIPSTQTMGCLPAGRVDWGDPSTKALRRVEGIHLHSIFVEKFSDYKGSRNGLVAAP